MEAGMNYFSCISIIISFILAHTNPVMLSFISLLYYKNLNDHVTMFVKAKRKENSITEYFEVLGGPNANPNYFKESEKFGKRIYKKKIVNKWHLLVFLIKNPILILDRKHYLLDFNNNSLKQSCMRKFLDYDFCSNLCKRRKYINEYSRLISED